MNEEIATLLQIVQNPIDLDVLYAEREFYEREIAKLNKTPSTNNSEKENQRKKFLQSLRKIDHKIDQAEEMTPDEAEKKLIEKIIASNPEKAKEFKKIEEKKALFTQEIEQIQKIQEAVELIAKEMKAALDAHNNRFRIIGWLFGKTPRSIATHHLQNASLLAKFLLDSIKKNEPSALLANIRGAAHTLWEAKDLRWSKKGYSELFTPLYQEFSLLQKALQEQIKHLEKELIYCKENFYNNI